MNQRASLGEVEGSRAESVELVNDLIADLVWPTSEMARVIGAVAQGDRSQTIATEVEGRRPLKGEFLRTARTVNAMVNQLNSFASEVTRVVRQVGTEGKLGGQADVRGVAGTWKDLTDNVNLIRRGLLKVKPTQRLVQGRLLRSGINQNLRALGPDTECHVVPGTCKTAIINDFRT
jgi:HAMP domain-containing protein